MSDNKNTATQKAKKRSKLKMFFYLLLLLIIGGGGLYVLGPREPVETALRFDSSQIGEDFGLVPERGQQSPSD